LFTNAPRPKLEITGTRPDGDLGGAYDIVVDKLRYYEKHNIYAFSRRFLGVVDNVPEAQSMLDTICRNYPIGEIGSKPSCVNWKIQRLYPSLLGLSVYAMEMQRKGNDADSWTHQLTVVTNTSVFQEETGKLIANIARINERIKNG
jgi:hypothetical protein